MSGPFVVTICQEQGKLYNSESERLGKLKQDSTRCGIHDVHRRGAGGAGHCAGLEVGLSIPRQDLSADSHGEQN